MSDELVDIAWFDTPIEARLAKMRLDGEGILAFVIGEHLGGMNVFGFAGGEGVRIQVRPEDAERAAGILERAADERGEEAGEETVPPFDHADEDVIDTGAAAAGERCPACGSPLVERRRDPEARGWLSRLLGRSGRVCRRCGHSWRDTDDSE